MQYELQIKPQNIKPHADIEHDIQDMKNGLFTFTLRISSGSIVDYSVVSYATAGEYLKLKSLVIEELHLPFDNGNGSKKSPLR